MQIILQEDVEKLGNRGEVVTVAEGYARNFLLAPQARARGHCGKYEAPRKNARRLCEKGSHRKGRCAEARGDACRGFS